MVEVSKAITYVVMEDVALKARASLLLQAVVEPVGKTTDGEIIVPLLPAWEEILALIQRDPRVVFEIDPRKWEEIIAASYERHGFDEVVLTPRSGDYGRDIIATRRGFFSVRIIESVKRYAPGHLVRASDVRELMGSLAGHSNASKGIISTTSGFAPRISEDPFIKPFVPHRVELVNGQQLLARLRGERVGFGVEAISVDGRRGHGPGAT